MMLLWDLYWPAVAAGLAIGVLAGWFAFRSGTSRSKRYSTLAAGILGAVGAAALWHGPAGTGARLATLIETATRAELVRVELPAITAQLDRSPALTRTLMLSGAADDFQREELPRYLAEIPGVADVEWLPARGGYAIPVIAEAAIGALVAFLLGLLLAWLIEVRRRARADWRW